MYGVKKSKYSSMVKNVRITEANVDSEVTKA